jgi:hypothetical protein
MNLVSRQFCRSHAGVLARGTPGEIILAVVLSEGARCHLIGRGIERALG